MNTITPFSAADRIKCESWCEEWPSNINKIGLPAGAYNKKCRSNHSVNNSLSIHPLFGDNPYMVPGTSS